MARESESEQQRDQDLENLFQAVGPRGEPPAEMRERIYEASLEAWEALPETSAKQPPALPSLGDGGQRCIGRGSRRVLEPS